MPFLRRRKSQSIMNNLKCKICGFEGRNLVTHLKFKHFCNSGQYRQKFGSCLLYLHSDELRKKISTTLKRLNKDAGFKKRNSDCQKNGASHFTIKYWMNRGFTENASKEKISLLQKNNCRRHLEKNDLQECSHFSPKFWIKRGYSPEDAKKEVSKLQSKLSSRSTKFLGHVRTNEQKERISSSVKKMIDVIGKGRWASHFGKFNGRSKIEIEFYNYIRENIDASVKANVPLGHYIVDVIKGKKIVEFYGDFWHGNPSIFSECKKLYPYGKSAMLVGDIWKKDNERISCLKSSGYDVIIVWESEWNKNKQECIDKIRQHLI